MNRIIKRTMCTLLLGGSLVLAQAPIASAHETVYAPHAVSDRYYAAHRVPVYPRWLRRDGAFQHWYVRSRYRYMRNMTWRRLYDRYRHEVGYYRHGRHYYPYRQWEKSYSNRSPARRRRSGD